MVKTAGSVMRNLCEFMFSRSTSYVAFECENHDGIKLAILHYGSDNNPQYHLADGPYGREISVDGEQLVEGRHLHTRLRTQGHHPSGALGVLHYRAILQGNGARLASPEQRALQRRFALVAQRSRLAGIERIESGAFSKDITFIALKRMAASVAYAEEDSLANLKHEAAEQTAEFDRQARAIAAERDRLESAIAQTDREERTWVEQDILAQAAEQLMKACREIENRANRAVLQ